MAHAPGAGTRDMNWVLLDIEHERAGRMESVRVVFGNGADILEILADLEFRDGDVVLSGCHVGGASANRIGIRGLLDLARWVKKELGIHALRIEGAVRTTGAGPGRRPRPLVF